MNHQAKQYITHKKAERNSAVDTIDAGDRPRRGRDISPLGVSSTPEPIDL